MELHTEGNNYNNLNLVLTLETFQDKNGTLQVLKDEDSKLITTECTGICSNGSLTQSVIKAICKERESGPEWVDDKEQTLTPETVISTWKDECQSCKDIKEKDPGSLFKWNCTLEVIITII